MSGRARKITFPLSVDLGAGKQRQVSVDLLGLPAGPPPTLATSASLQRLKSARPDLYAALAPHLAELRRLEGELFHWLRSDPAHPQAFAQDALGALQQACHPSAELVAAIQQTRAAAGAGPDGRS